MLFHECKFSIRTLEIWLDIWRHFTSEWKYIFTSITLCSGHNQYYFLPDWTKHFFFTDDVESLKSPQRGIIQSIFCCWRRNRTKTTQNGLPVFNSGQSVSTLQGRHRHLLPQIRHQDMHKKCMVIDLDETLVHSSFKVSNF